MKYVRWPWISVAIVALATLTVTVAACGGQEEATPTAPEAEAVQPIELRMAATSSPTDPLFPASKEYAERVEERTEGRVKIAVSLGSELGGEREMLEATKLGTVQMTVVGFNGSMKYLGTLLPYLFRDAEHMWKVLEGPIGQQWAEELVQEQGLRIIGYGYRNPRHLTTTDREGACRAT